MNNIIFRYKKQNEAWESLDIEIDEYFDLEPNEKVSTYSVTNYLLPEQYIDVPTSQIEYIQISINIGSNRSELKKTFWNKGINSITERLDSSPKERHLIILSTLIDKEKKVFETIRLDRINDFLFPEHHSLIQDNPDGTETELYNWRK